MECWKLQRCEGLLAVGAERRLTAINWEHFSLLYGAERAGHRQALQEHKDDDTTTIANYNSKRYVQECAWSAPRTVIAAAACQCCYCSPAMDLFDPRLRM